MNLANVRAKTSRKDPQAVGPHVSWVTVGKDHVVEICLPQSIN